MTAIAASWLAHGKNLRDRLLSSRRFQEWAAAFPLTRPIARRQARDLFDLCAGFVYSQVLFACVELDLFERLARSPQSVEELAARLEIPVDSCATLMRAAASLDLVETDTRGRYRLGSRGAVMRANPGIAAMVRHHALLYRDLADPIALLRGERGSNALAAHWPYAGNSNPRDLAEAQIADYTRLMAASQPFVAAEILGAYPFERAGHRCLLDVGGGDGSFLTQVAAQTERMQLMLFDLPAVADKARERFERQCISARASAYGGDMRSDSLPDGADIVSLVRVLHDHDDDHALAILRNIHRVLPANGHLLIAEPLADTPGAGPMGDAYFGFYLMAMGSGRPRTPARIEAMLQRAGFARVRELPTRMPLLTRLMTARREP